MVFSLIFLFFHSLYILVVRVYIQFIGSLASYDLVVRVLSLPSPSKQNSSTQDACLQSWGNLLMFFIFHVSINTLFMVQGDQHEKELDRTTLHLHATILHKIFTAFWSNDQKQWKKNQKSGHFLRGRDIYPTRCMISFSRTINDT